MSLNIPIGGYFELELQNRNNFPQPNGTLLNSGHHAIEYVLRSLAKVSKVYIPYYTCSIVLRPLSRLNLTYEFYHINENLEIKEDIQLDSNEYLIYTNYFGLKDKYAASLVEKYGNKLIIDNAQALLAERIEGINTIYSPRKYVGIPDGGIAYTGEIESSVTLLNELEQDQSYDRCSHLLKRYDLGASGGYEDFHVNSDKFCDDSVKFMSNLSRAILQSIDFEKVKAQRWQNFKQLHEALGNSNLLDIEKVAGIKSTSVSSSFACPMVYPYMTDNADLKKHLIANKIFVATYWPNVFDWCSPEDWEYQLADRCLALPIDQRYGEEEMKYIIESIQLYDKQR